MSDCAGFKCSILNRQRLAKGVHFKKMQELLMKTHRFGQKIRLPSTIAIKHELRKLMFEDSIKEAEITAETADAVRRSASEKTPH
jgi:hypothetical protein